NLTSRSRIAPSPNMKVAYTSSARRALLTSGLAATFQRSPRSPRPSTRTAVLAVAPARALLVLERLPEGERPPALILQPGHVLGMKVARPKSAAMKSGVEGH